MNFSCRRRFFNSPTIGNTCSLAAILTYHLKIFHYRMFQTLQELTNLYKKSQEIFKNFKQLNEKDIRRKHIEIIGGQILVSIMNLRINMEFSERNKDVFSNMFNSDHQQIDNYA